ncbi:NUDIX hydrolase [Candidatus Uhrbacteria bacterium]|nr:NUDIX hydrolase [Candidatus Uhrbacteria bacterium]
MTWKTLKTTLIEGNPFLRFYVDEFETPTGKRGKYYYHVNGYTDGFVSVFVQTQNNTFIMTQEYRYLFDRVSLANPKGGIGQSESIEEAAMRETIEECGYKPAELISLGWIASANSISKERMHLFLGRNSVWVGQKLDEAEEITVREMTAAQIDEAIASGEIWDGSAISGWVKVKLFLGL